MLCIIHEPVLQEVENSIHNLLENEREHEVYYAVSIVDLVCWISGILHAGGRHWIVPHFAVLFFCVVLCGVVWCGVVKCCVS